MRRQNRLLASIVIAAIITVLTTGSAIAQTTKPNSPSDVFTASAMTPGAPAGSFALSDFETVNLYNGSLSFRLPLMPIGGRGDLGYQKSLIIENHWQFRAYQYSSGPGGSSTPTIPPHRPESTWTGIPGMPKPEEVGLLYMRRVRDKDPSPSIGGGTNIYSCNTLTQLTFINLDGTEISLRDTQTDGTPQLTSGGNTYNRGTVFADRVGSSSVFVSDAPIYDVACNDTSFGTMNNLTILKPSGYLYFDTGAKYRIDNGSVTWVKDRNGNILTNLGRPTDYATRKGFGGQDKPITISTTPLSQNLRAGFTIKTYAQLFPNVVSFLEGAQNTYNPNVTSSVTLPDGRQYKFQYTEMGELARIELPTGGVIEYDWSGEAILSNDRIIMLRQVTERRTYLNNSTTQWNNRTVYAPGTTNLSFPSECNGILPCSAISVKQYGRDDNGNQVLMAQSTHLFFGSAINSFYSTTFNFYPNALEGKEFRTEVLDTNGALKAVTENTWKQQNPNLGRPNNLYVEKTVSTLADTNQVSQKTFAYDQYLNVTDTYEYDFGTGAPGAFMRRSHTDYLTTSSYLNYTGGGAFLRRLPSQTWVSSDLGGNAKKSLTVLEYDNYNADGNNSPLMNRANVYGFDTNYGTTYATRGNVTSVTTFADAQTPTQPIKAYSNFDILGNVTKTIDAKGNASFIYYDDNFGAPNAETRTNSAPAELGGQQTFAFPTSATNPQGWTRYAQFDYFTGAGVDAEDIHGNVSSMYYNDLLDRPTQTVVANNTSLKSQATIVYDDANRRVQQTSDLFTFGDNLAKTESFYDGLGRTFEIRNYRDGTYVISLKEYDSLGRVKRATNPYKPGESQLWTTTAYDALGRPVSVTTPDNAVVTTAYSGNVVTVTDQAGKPRRSITNGLGQLIRVDEPDDNGNLGTVSSPTQATYYTYDTLNNLVQVNQGVQQRNFTYNNLSRLLTATNPESGTIGYVYDNNGNLTQKTDARGVVTTYVYDNINRVTSRSYSDGTPAVSYTYENVNIPFSKGRLTQVSSSVSTTNYTQFDNLGRLLASQQITDGQTYNFGYQYNLSGMVVEETYPSGRKVRNTFETDGDLALVDTQLGGGIYQPRVGNFSYTSAGAVGAMQLGNGKWENTVFNSRLQPVQIGLGNSQNTQELWKVNYVYGNGSDNNGNVTQQTITVPGQFTAVQNYSYDSLNRLKQATETIGGNQTWKQTFLFDRYGNRTFDASQTTTLGNCPQNVCNPSINSANNRVVGHSFDNAGNTTIDAEGRQFFYNGENKQKEVRDAQNNIIGQYLYDGDGKRVKKLSANDTTIFVYDAAGKLASEYLITALQSQAPTTSYLTNDTLGSPRVTTDLSGNVISRRDFRPYGEEIYRLNHGSDKIRQKFTSYERDNESDLDFAQARMYSYGYGRFTSPDPYGGSGYVSIPQSWNRYSYCLNRPFVFTDPSGLIWLTNDGENYTWVNDEYYNSERGRKEYNGWNPANGAVIKLKSAKGFKGKYKDLVGSFVSLNADGTISAAAEPATVNIEWGNSDPDEDLKIALGSVDVKYLLKRDLMGPPGGSRRINKTIRYYNADGKAWVDVDYEDNHPESGNPHIHWWDWSGQEPERSEDEPVPEWWGTEGETEDGEELWSPNARVTFFEVMGRATGRVPSRSPVKSRSTSPVRARPALRLIPRTVIP